jgi:hypothetical protein
MTRAVVRTFMLGLLVLAAPAAARAQGLSGLWSAEVTATGERITGLAAFTPDGGGAARIAGRGQRVDGSAVTWTGTATAVAQGLRLDQTRPGSTSTLAGTLARTSDGFSGDLSPAGSTARWHVTYRHLALPAMSFTPDRLRLQTGLSATVTLGSDMPGASSLVAVSGPAAADLDWSYRDGRLQARAARSGSFVLRATIGGARVAELRVDVAGGVLDEVLARVRDEAGDGDGVAPIVVFDLDDTLFDTRWRTRSTLRDFGDQYGDDRLSSLAVDDVRWDLADTLRAAGLSAAEVRGSEGRAAESFERPHLSDYELDHAFPGAVDFVKAVQAAGGRVAYVTGRSDSRRQVSEDVLARAGFPVQGTLRYFRPASSASIPAYKGRVTRDELPRYGVVVACIDNEPANCNAFRYAAPRAVQVFFDSQYPTDSPALAAGVETISAWR